MEENFKKQFPIPLWTGWAINIIGWVIFVSTFDHQLEILTGLLCLGCIYVGYKHKELGTKPVNGNSSLSAANLIYASAFEAAWMFAWGFGLFGDFNF